MANEGRSHSRSQFLLDTNGALQERTIRRKSFKINASEYFYSIQIATFYSIQMDDLAELLPTRQTRNPLLKRELQCYNRAPRVSTQQLPFTSHSRSNRQPRRLETIATARKQTPATRFNRQLSSVFAHGSGARDSQPSTINFELQQVFTDHESQVTNHESTVNDK